MVAPSEGLQGQAREQQPVQKGLLREIASDVAACVSEFPGIPQARLIGEFQGDLIARQKTTLDKFSPGGEYYDAMKFFHGDGFTKQPLAKKVRMTAEVNAKSYKEKSEMTLAGLKRLYSNYQAAPQGEHSQQAWEEFAKAFKLCNAYTYRGRLESCSSPQLEYNEYENFNLPSLYEESGKFGETPPDLGRDLTLVNTELQLQLARAVGILQPNETWLDFIYRDSIKVVDRLHQRSKEDKGFILAKGDIFGNFTLGGMPQAYYDVPIKYPGVNVSILFDFRSDTTGKYNQKLDDLITSGDLSPRIMLRIPTPTLLGLDQE